MVLIGIILSSTSGSTTSATVLGQSYAGSAATSSTLGLGLVFLCIGIPLAVICIYLAITQNNARKILRADLARVDRYNLIDDGILRNMNNDRLRGKIAELRTHPPDSNLNALTSGQRSTYYPVPSSQWKPPENATSFVERDGSSHVEPPDAEHVALSKNGASEDHETRLVEHLERIDPGTSFNRLAAKNRAMLSHVAEPEVVSSIPYNTGFSQFEGEPVLRHADERTEREVVVEKDRCLVCDAILAGTTYICPTCETKYCMRCAKLMASNGDTCWRCKQPFDLAD